MLILCSDTFDKIDTFTFIVLTKDMSFGKVKSGKILEIYMQNSDPDTFFLLVSELAK